MSGKPCPDNCQCRKHVLSPEHRAKMSASVSAAMKRSWARRKAVAL